MILKETGWTRHYLLWKVSWINLQMMIADAPTVRKKSTKKKVKEVTGRQLAERLKSRKR